MTIAHGDGASEGSLSVMNFTGKVASPCFKDYAPDGKLQERLADLKEDFGLLASKAKPEERPDLGKDLDKVIPSADINVFDQTEATRWQTGKDIHVILFHHEAWQACQDGDKAMRTYYFSLYFMGVPPECIWVYPFARSMDTCKKAWFQAGEGNDRKIHFHFIDAVPPYEDMSAEVVDWFNSKIAAGVLKVWVMDHHYVPALTFAKWIPCSSFHPALLTRHSTHAPLAAAGSEPSSWSAFQLLRSLHFSVAGNVGEQSPRPHIRFAGKEWSYLEVVELFRQPAAMATFGDMLTFAMVTEIRAFAVEHLLEYFENNQGCLDAAMLFHDCLLQEEPPSNGGVLAAKGFDKDFATEAGALAIWSDTYLQATNNGLPGQYALLNELAVELSSDESGLIPAEYVRHLCTEYRKTRDESGQRAYDQFAIDVFDKKIKLLEYLQTMQELVKATAKNIAENILQSVETYGKVAEYTTYFTEGNPSRMGRLFNQWMPIYLKMHGLDTETEPVLVLFMGRDNPDPVAPIARLSGRLFPQPTGMVGGEWIVENQKEIFDVFETRVAQYKDEYVITKTTSFGAGGTVFLERPDVLVPIAP